MCQCVLQPKENGAKKDAKGGVAIRLPYLRVVDVQDDSDSDSFTATFTWGLGRTNTRCIKHCSATAWHTMRAPRSVAAAC